MQAIEIKPDIYWVGAVDWDRRLFDELIPLPDGTSYNAYLVRGCEKTALIDTVDPTMTEVLLSRLDRLGVHELDYIVASHGEQDHSGSLPAVAAKYSQAQILATPKCQKLLENLLQIDVKRIVTVDDGETISLGDKTLEFIHAPWVHWPETMLTFLREDGILFPCDLFGSHLASSDLYVSDECHVYEAAKRYYAEIMMPFRLQIEKHLERLANYQMEIIAPSHGPLYPRPQFITDAYREWTGAPPKNIVVLPYVSMHDSTRRIVNYFVDALCRRGVGVKQFNLTVTDIGELAKALVDAATIIIGVPTVLGGPHPVVAHAAFLANALRPKTRFAGIIGSYGWGSRAKEEIIKMIPNLKAELLEPVVMAQGLPKAADYEALDALAATIAEKHQGLPS